MRGVTQSMEIRLPWKLHLLQLVFTVQACLLYRTGEETLSSFFLVLRGTEKTSLIGFLHWHNSFMNVTGINTYVLIAFKACSTRWNPFVTSLSSMNL